MTATLVRDVMTTDPHCLSPANPLTDAWTLLVNGGFHHLPVVDDGRLVGVLSAADLIERLRSQDPHLKDTGVILDEGTIGEIMSSDVVSIDADAPAAQAVRRLSVGDIHALPVVSGGKVVGIVTSTDLARMLLSHLEEGPST